MDFIKRLSIISTLSISGLATEAFAGNDHELAIYNDSDSAKQVVVTSLDCFYTDRNENETIGYLFQVAPHTTYTWDSESKAKIFSGCRGDYKRRLSFTISDVGTGEHANSFRVIDEFTVTSGSFHYIVNESKDETWVLTTGEPYKADIRITDANEYIGYNYAYPGKLSGQTLESIGKNQYVTSNPDPKIIIHNETNKQLKVKSISNKCVDNPDQQNVMTPCLFYDPSQVIDYPISPSGGELEFPFHVNMNTYESIEVFDGTIWHGDYVQIPTMIRIQLEDSDGQRCEILGTAKEVRANGDRVDAHEFPVSYKEQASIIQNYLELSSPNMSSTDKPGNTLKITSHYCIHIVHTNP